MFKLPGLFTIKAWLFLLYFESLLVSDVQQSCWLQVTFFRADRYGGARATSQPITGQSVETAEVPHSDISEAEINARTAFLSTFIIDELQHVLLKAARDGSVFGPGSARFRRGHPRGGGRVRGRGPRAGPGTAASDGALRPRAL